MSPRARPPPYPHTCSDATSYTQVFEQVAPGTYTIRVTAVNDNNPAKTSVSTTAAQTGNLVVGERQGSCVVSLA